MGGAVLEALSDAGHPARITRLAVRGLLGSKTPQGAHGGGRDLSQPRPEAARHIVAA
jgi:hypothetical protein